MSRVQRLLSRALSSSSPLVLSQLRSSTVGTARQAARHTAEVTLQRAGPSATHLALPPVESPERSRALTCCLIGPTNAGKSTLLNALLDHRVSAVSPKIHTTRENTIGYLTDRETLTQVEFLDAPGALGPDVPALHRAIWDAVSSADLALIVVDASDRLSCRQVGRFLSRLDRELSELQQSHGRRPQTALVLNKVDRVRPKELLLKTSRTLHKQHAFDHLPFMISARTGDGVDLLRTALLLHARPREWMAPEGCAHLQPPLTRATEIIRELIFNFFSKELPYSLEQRNLGWTELEHPAGGLRIDQQLVLPRARARARKIVERRMPGLATAARTALRQEFGRPVFLHLSLQVAKNDHVDGDSSELL